MGEPRYVKTNATAKRGVNHVKLMIKMNKHKFVNVHDEDDIGLDCFIQKMENTEPTTLIGVQIKSGDSFFNFSNQKCSIPIKNHKKYWLNNSLPIYGIVFVPSLLKAFWCDLRSELSKNETNKIVTFTASPRTELNLSNFNKEMQKPFLYKERYLKIVQEIVKTDAVLKTFINHVLREVTPFIERLINYNDFESFLSEINYEIIGESRYQKHSDCNEIIGVRLPYNGGEFYIHKFKNEIYYTDEFEKQIHLTLSNLRELFLCVK